MNNLTLSFLVMISFSSLASNEITTKEKHHEDPTKVITKIGLGYADDLTISGSLALDDVRKLNANINQDGNEWRLGGSWLFDFGIINFSFGQNEYDNGGKKKNYSIGTFLPLQAFGVNTGKWMIFPLAGFNHNVSEHYTSTEENTLEELTTIQNTSNGGYLGGLFLRPINSEWSAMTIMGGGLGSGGYSNYWGGVGMSYKINSQHSCNFFGYASEDDFGTVKKLVFNYTYEFK